jgi:predicted ATPase
MDEQNRTGENMRTFIRHPSDIPIEIHSEGGAPETERHLNNVSAGGLSFKSAAPLAERSIITVRISIVKPAFEATGRVVWCRQENGIYDIGVEFTETRDVFKARMIEQVCHIEHYKKEIREKEGRELSGREAALEWIDKYAKKFQAETIEK